jgi:RNA polymerase-binding transcription factor DksA
MTSTVLQQRRSLSKSQVQEIRMELARQSRRFAPDDPRGHAFTAALKRIELGTYGYCAVCSSRIPHDRLSVVPETVYCVSCRAGNS